MAQGGKRPGAGRPKGTPNKITGDLRAMISKALQDAGGAKYLQRQAEEEPAAFLALVGKTLPKDVNLNAQGSLSITIGLSNGPRRNPTG